MEKLTHKIGEAINKAVKRRQGWYTIHMAATTHAITQRLPFVNWVLEVRDARIPLSSQCTLLTDLVEPCRHVIVLNKTDLVCRSQLQEWFRFFKQRNCLCCGVNSHNKDSVKEFLNFLQARVREAKKNDNSNYTVTMMIVGIPNVGKSALANSLHQIGRISATEKGKLRHATVSPYPGETRDISSLKIGSHPNIYVLDTPGILPPKIVDYEVCSKLAVTGAIRDSLAGEKDLAQYFLSVHNLSDEYKKWKRFSTCENKTLSEQRKADSAHCHESDIRREKQHLSDHTQDFIVQAVRRTLFETILCFDGNLEKEEDMEKLIAAQFTALAEAFRIPAELGEDVYVTVAVKLLNLYRTGRLGHYILEHSTMKESSLQ